MVAGTTVAVVLVDETLVVGTGLPEASSDTLRLVEGLAVCDDVAERSGVTDATTAVMAKSTASSPAATARPRS
jgi:hypothetical protein